MRGKFAWCVWGMCSCWNGDTNTDPHTLILYVDITFQDMVCGIQMSSKLNHQTNNVWFEFIRILDEDSVNESLNHSAKVTHKELFLAFTCSVLFHVFFFPLCRWAAHLEVYIVEDCVELLHGIHQTWQTCFIFFNLKTERKTQTEGNSNWQLFWFRANIKRTHVDVYM